VFRVFILRLNGEFVYGKFIHYLSHLGTGDESQVHALDFIGRGVFYDIAAFASDTHFEVAQFAQLHRESQFQKTGDAVEQIIDARGGFHLG